MTIDLFWPNWALVVRVILFTITRLENNTNSEPANEEPHSEETAADREPISVESPTESHSPDDVTIIGDMRVARPEVIDLDKLPTIRRGTKFCHFQEIKCMKCPTFFVTRQNWHYWLRQYKGLTYNGMCLTFFKRWLSSGWFD